MRQCGGLVVFFLNKIFCANRISVRDQDEAVGNSKTRSVRNFNGFFRRPPRAPSTAFEKSKRPSVDFGATVHTHTHTHAYVCKYFNATVPRWSWKVISFSFASDERQPFDVARSYRHVPSDGRVRWPRGADRQTVVLQESAMVVRRESATGVRWQGR